MSNSQSDKAKAKSNSGAPKGSSSKNAVKSGPAKPRQLLHLVFGGELEKLGKLEFRDVENLDIIGIFPNYATARAAWKDAAQRTVDNAHMRYFIVHMHRLLDPDEDQAADQDDA